MNWQDKHSGLRRHKLMTKELAGKIPAIGSTKNAADIEDVVVPAKLFSPYSSWTWYVLELNPDTGECFGLVDTANGHEYGYFELTELSELKFNGMIPMVERDLYWVPRTVGEIRRTA